MPSPRLSSGPVREHLNPTACKFAGIAASRGHSAERVAGGGEEARGRSCVAHHDAGTRAQPDGGGAEQCARVARAAHGRTREEDRRAHVRRHAFATQRWVPHTRTVSLPATCTRI